MKKVTIDHERMSHVNSNTITIITTIIYRPVLASTHNRFAARLEYVRDHPGVQVPERQNQEG